MKDRERELFERYKKFVQGVTANAASSEDQIEKYSRTDYLKWVKSIIFFVLILWALQYVAKWVTHSSTSSSDRFWSFYFAIGVAVWLYWKNQFQELRIRMKTMDVMLREIQLSIPMIVPHRPVSMHEYLSERAAWKTTDRLDGRTDDGIETEYTPASHDLVVKGIKCLAIGEDYEHGQSVPEDKDLAEAWYRKAVSWYELAAGEGDSYAQEKLGDLYSEGRGIPRDHLKALNLWCEAANRGRASAQYKLAEMYYLGRDIQKNFCESCFWFEIIITSHGAGFVEMKRLAAQRREYAAKKMTPEELSHVQERVRQWVGARAAKAESNQMQ